MAATYSADYNLATSDSAFPNRVQMAIIDASKQVSNEATSTTNHTNRVALAKAVMLNPTAYVQAFTYAICVDTTVVVGLSDTVMLTAVQNVWNAMAGVV